MQSTRVIAPFAVAYLFLFGLLFPKSLCAQNETELSTARELAKEGLAAYDEGRFEEAARLLEKAYAVVQMPTLAVNCARVLVKLGRPLKAAELLLRAARLPPRPDWAKVQLEAQQAAVAEREQLLPRIPRLTIELKGAEPGQVEVTLDGNKVTSALLSVPQMVEPGERIVTGRRYGVEWTQRIQILEGERKTAILDFAETAQTSESAIASASGSGNVASQSSSAKAMRTAGWVSLGIGGAGVALGGITGLLLIGKKSDLDDGGCEGTRCYDDQASDVDSFNRYRTLSTIGFVMGAVGTAAGVTLLLTTPEGSRSEMALLVGADSLALEGSF